GVAAVGGARCRNLRRRHIIPGGWSQGKLSREITCRSSPTQVGLAAGFRGYLHLSEDFEVSASRRFSAREVKIGDAEVRASLLRLSATLGCTRPVNDLPLA